MYPDLDRVSLFCMLRHFKPKQMVEIGSGESTGVALQAFKENLADGAVACNHTVRSTWCL